MKTIFLNKTLLLLVAFGAALCLLPINVSAQWVDSGDNAYLENTTGFIGIRTHDDNHGLILRDYTGGTVDWSGIRHVNNGNADRLEFAVKSHTSYGKSLVLTQNNRVGIGTISPAAKLHIEAGSGEGLRIISDYGNTHIPWAGNGWSYIAGQGIIFRTTGSNTERMRITAVGKVRIGGTGTTIPDGYKLFVEEGILTEQVKVATVNSAAWADYVFDEDYDLKSTEEVETFIQENKHLPNVPSAEEVSENGVDMVEMDATLLRQIEELWLHVIESKKKIQTLEAQLEQK